MLFCAAGTSNAWAQNQLFPYRALIAHGDVAAIEQFATANPDHPDVPVARALVARARGDDDAAVAALKAAAESGHHDAALELGLL